MPQSAFRVLTVTALFVGLFTWGCAGKPSGDADHPSLPSNDGGLASDVRASDDGSANAFADAASTTDPLVVMTDKGTIRGKQAGTGFAFLGVPYAKPPVGALRLMPPLPADSWSDERDATNFGKICVQSALALNYTKVDGDEDCLTLNVWTPSVPSTAKESLPVVVWKHGGFFLLGSSNQTNADGTLLFDGQALANANHEVVVTFNYRLGALGFLAHPALAAANPQHTTGNYALLDSLLVLQWVQNNIASFNGDKSRVMLFGESAGAIDTCALVSSPLAKGLFSTALMESGNCAAETLDYRYKDEASIVDEIGCSKASDVVACLQSAPLSALVEAGGNKVAGTMIINHTTNVDPVHFMSVPIGPTVDNYVLDDIPLAKMQAGTHNHVPLLLGTNSREMAFLLPPALVPSVAGKGCTEYAALVNVMFPGVTHPELPGKLLAAYPCDPQDPQAGYETLVKLTSGGFFACPTRRALRAAASTQTEPVYRYFYTHAHSSGGYAVLGAAHSAELAFVWPAFNYFGMTPTPGETLLAQQVQAYWTNFAATGNPNGGVLPNWKAYDATVDNALELATPVNETSAIDEAGCDVWDTVQ